MNHDFSWFYDSSQHRAHRRKENEGIPSTHGTMSKRYLSFILDIQNGHVAASNITEDFKHIGVNNDTIVLISFTIVKEWFKVSFKKF